MGAWSGGLYSSDFAADLRAAIEALLRAPLSDDDILAEIAAGFRPVDGDHVDAFDYWLVLADQLERRGFHRQEIFERAAGIIGRGEDLAALARLDTAASAIASRRKAGAALLRRLANPRPPRVRRPLKVPQPLLFEAGEAITWPTDRGRHKSPWISGGFVQDGWGFAIVSDVGHLYGVFAYQAVQALKWRRRERPSPALAGDCPRSEHRYGTITPDDLEQLGIERLGRVPDAGLGPPLDPDSAAEDARRVVLQGGGLPKTFNWDAFNFSIGPGPRFMFMAPSGSPIDPDEPDCRSGMFGDREDELPPLRADKPATRAYYLQLLRERTRRDR